MHADNIEFRWNSEVTKLLFDRQIRGIRVKNHEGLCENIDIDGLFISIGQKPETSLFREQLTLDETGYIVADETTRTNVAGVYAAGDIRSKRIRQIVTAVADGAVAACFAEQYLVKT